MFKLSSQIREPHRKKQLPTTAQLDLHAHSDSDKSETDTSELYVDDHIYLGNDLAEEEKAMITSYLNNPPALHVRR